LGGIAGRSVRWYADRLVRTQRLLEADSWYQWATVWGDSSAELWLARARLARKLARDPAFAAALQKSLDRGLGKERYRLEVLLAQAQRGDLEPLAARLADLFIQGQETDEICLAYVEGCILKYRLNDAMQILVTWEADYPTDPRPNFLKGRIFEHEGNPAKAKTEYRNALKKSPVYAAAAYNLARVLETEQQPEGALTFYRTAARLSRYPGPSLISEARCLRLLQRYEEARTALKRAADAASNHDAEMARLLGDPAESAAAGLVTERGLLAVEEGRPADAVRDLQAAIEIEPLNWKTRYQLALAQQELGQTDAAAENFRRVKESRTALEACDTLFDTLARDPENLAARLQIGQTLLKHLSEHQGIVWLDSVLDRDPENQVAHRSLAEHYRSRIASDPDFRRLAEHHEQHLKPAGANLGHPDR